MSEIYTMTSRMINQSNMLDKVAHNMANVNTNGFKRQSLSFQSVVDDKQLPSEQPMSFSTVKSQDIDFSKGGIDITNNKLDVSINGDGFFGVRRENGNVVYSRDGQFLINPTGQLVNSSGEEILGIDEQPIDIPVGTKNIQITAKGEVYGDGAFFGEIAIFDFNDKTSLIAAGKASFASPEQPTLDPNTLLVVGALEKSNVNAIQESVELTKVSRAYESAASLIKTFEDLESRSIRELFKVQ